MSIISSLISYAERQRRRECKEAILSLLEISPGSSLLDLGSGGGEMALIAGQKTKSARICGTDIREECLSMMESKGIIAYQVDLNKHLPFDDESFDVALASQTIEHLYDTDLFVEEVSRILKVGGYLVMATPNLASWHAIFSLLLGRQPPTVFVSDEFELGFGQPKIADWGPTHRRVFTMHGLRSLLEWHGFKVESCRGAGFAPFPSPLCKLLLFIDRRHSAYIIMKARKPPVKQALLRRQ